MPIYHKKHETELEQSISIYYTDLLKLGLLSLGEFYASVR